MDQDEADLRLILAVIDALREWEQAAGREARLKPLREAVWFYWQQPRLAGRSVRAKYPRDVPWSRAARGAQEDGQVGLVIEHTKPMKVLLRELLDRPPADLSQLRGRLDEGLSCVVITEDENAQLAKAGMASGPADEDGDPFDRYYAAELEVDGFRPLDP